MKFADRADHLPVSATPTQRCGAATVRTGTPITDGKATTVAFPCREAAEFVRDVKARVAAYFESTRRSSKGRWSMWLKTVLLFGAVAVPYAAIMSNRFTPLTMLGLAVV